MAALAELQTTGMVIASHNPGKIREIGELLAPLGIAVVSAGELGVPEPEETGETFIANARLKAQFVQAHTGRPSLADDSGLAVAALDGAPGIYSARWAGPQKDFTLAMERIRDELVQRGQEPQGAQAAFICSLAIAWPSGEVWDVEGRIDGHLTFPPRGKNGFGYDPIFIAEGYRQTFGEIAPEEKHAVSHRARAFKALLARLETAEAA